MTCPHCGEPQHDAGQSEPPFCDTPGCPGNYYGGNREQEQQGEAAREAFFAPIRARAPVVAPWPPEYRAHHTHDPAQQLIQAVGLLAQAATVIQSNRRLRRRHASLLIDMADLAGRASDGLELAGVAKLPQDPVQLDGF